MQLQLFDIQVYAFEEYPLKVIFGLDDNVRCINARINIYGDMSFEFDVDSFSCLSYRATLEGCSDKMIQILNQEVLSFILSKEQSFQTKILRKIEDMKNNMPGESAGMKECRKMLEKFIILEYFYELSHD